jgi:hypothetical protein
VRRATLITIAIAFAGGCVGLYYSVWVAWEALILHRPKYPVPEFSWICLSYHGWLLAAPVPFLVWLVIALRKGGPSTDHVTLFAAVASLVFVAVFFVATIAVVLPWAARVDFLGTK